MRCDENNKKLFFSFQFLFGIHSKFYLYTRREEPQRKKFISNKKEGKENDISFVYKQQKQKHKLEQINRIFPNCINDNRYQILKTHMITKRQMNLFIILLLLDEMRK
jgi:hypothetical protein